MNLRKTLLAASIAALPAMATVQAHAANQLMAAPVNQLSPQENAALVARLSSRSNALSLDAGHGFAIAAQHPGAIGTFSSQSAFEGSKYAWLGGNGTTSTETLSQSVTIPASATSATLSFALHIDTAETGTTAYDRLKVNVKNAAGALLGTLATYSNATPAAGYQTRTFSLLAYKGQTVQLSFDMTEDSSLQTSFVVDKVSLIAQ